MLKRVGIGCLWLVGGFVGLIVLVAIFGPRGTSTVQSTTKPQATPTQQANAAITVTTAAVKPTEPPKPAATVRPTATAKPESTPAPTLPSVGDTVAAGSWEISVNKLDSATKIGAVSAQGAFLVITIGAKNLHQDTSALNSFDFQVTSNEGKRYSSSSEGTTALIGSPGPEVLFLTVQVQPGLTKQFRLVFDVNPADTGLTLKAAGIVFRL